MDHKQPILHELLQQHQEPFHLKTYISDKRSQCKLNNSSPPESCAHRSTLRNDPCGGGFLHIPSRTSAVLIEAATRIQKQRQPKSKTQIRNVGVSVFGSFFKILKHRSKAQRNYDAKERENSEEIRISCRLCRDDNFRASNTTSTSFHDSADFEARFASSPISPFRFSPPKSPTSFSSRRTPDLCSPATSPIRRVKQEKENSSTVVNGVEEEKEQCSPVSVLDTDALYEDDEHESLVGEEDDYDLERSYANIERARQQLLERLERFEKLAALDQVDLEQKLLEAAEEESETEGVEFELLPLRRKQDLYTSSLKQSHMKMKKKVIGEDKFKIDIGHLWRDIIDVMVVLEFKTEMEETAAEVEVAIFEELMEQCFCMDPQLNIYATT